MRQGTSTSRRSRSRNSLVSISKPKKSKPERAKNLSRVFLLRIYRPEDVAILKKIYDMLYNQGYTIRGAQRILKGQGRQQIASTAQTQQNINGTSIPSSKDKQDNKSPDNFSNNKALYASNNSRPVEKTTSQEITIPTKQPETNVNESTFPYQKNATVSISQERDLSAPKSLDAAFSETISATNIQPHISDLSPINSGIDEDSKIIIRSLIGELQQIKKIIQESANR